MSNQSFHAHRDNPTSAHPSSAGQSNVGYPNIYGDDDQRKVTLDEVDRVTRLSGHNLRAYMGNYSKNQPSMARRLSEEEERMYPHTEADYQKMDPTLPATMHNNEPSRGAKIDADLLAEDADELRRKGKA